MPYYSYLLLFLSLFHQKVVRELKKRAHIVMRTLILVGLDLHNQDHSRVPAFEVSHFSL